MTVSTRSLHVNTSRINGRVASTSVGTAPASASAVGPSSGTASHNVEGDACAISDMIFNVDMAMGNCPKYLHIRDLLKEEQAPRSPIIKVPKHFIGIKRSHCDGCDGKPYRSNGSSAHFPPPSGPCVLTLEQKPKPTQHVVASPPRPPKESTKISRCTGANQSITMFKYILVLDGNRTQTFIRNEGDQTCTPLS